MVKERDEGEEGEWGDWRDELGGAVCLFCPVTYHDTGDLRDHMNIVHGFDLEQIKRDLKLNFYQQVTSLLSSLFSSHFSYD